MSVIKQIQEDHRKWAAHNFPNAVSWQPLIGVIEELGELSHSFLKLSQGIRGTPDEHKKNMADAVGDVFIYLTHFCNLEGLDLEHAFMKTRHVLGIPSWNVLLSASKQVGLLASAFQVQSKEDMEDMAGGLLISLLRFSSLEGIEMFNAIGEAWAQVRERDWIRFPGKGLCPICGNGMSCQGHDPIPAEPSGPLVMVGSGVHQSPRHIDDPQFAPHHTNVKTCVCGGSGTIGTMFPVNCPCCRPDPEILKTVTEDHPHE